MHFSPALSSLGFLGLAASAAASVPAATYDGGCSTKAGVNASIELRIGNGGAGQSGLVQALADKFIQSRSDNCKDKKQLIKINWIKGDTTETLNYMKQGGVDVGITYSVPAENIAIQNGIAKGCKYYEEDNWKPCFGDRDECEGSEEKPCYAFRDHFYLVGPKNNGAGIEEEDDTLQAFSKIYNAGEAGKAKFLSRFDKSATNIKDSELFVAIGQTPWAGANGSSWYHEHRDYPLQALTEASRLQEYTITDRGTFLTLQSQNKTITDALRIYKTGGLEPEKRALLNPADLVVAQKPHNDEIAWEFVEWTLSEEGQATIVNFHKAEGQPCLYKGYPSVRFGLEPFECRWDVEDEEHSEL